MSAAAVAGAKARKRKQRLEKKRREEAALLETYFREHDVSGTGKMNREEMRSLLTGVKREFSKDPTAEVKDELLDRIMTLFDVSEDGQIERRDLLKAVKKYKAMVRFDMEQQQALKQLFERHDKDKSGQLSADQLLSLIQELAADKGVVQPTAEGDVSFIIDQCDAAGTGMSERPPPSLPTPPSPAWPAPPAARPWAATGSAVRSQHRGARAGDPHLVGGGQGHDGGG